MSRIEQTVFSSPHSALHFWDGTREGPRDARLLRSAHGGHRHHGSLPRRYATTPSQRSKRLGLVKQFEQLTCESLRGNEHISIRGRALSSIKVLLPLSLNQTLWGSTVQLWVFYQRWFDSFVTPDQMLQGRGERPAVMWPDCLQIWRHSSAASSTAASTVHPVQITAR